MGLVFGAYAREGLSGPFRSRWEHSMAWLRSTYPNLAVQERRQGGLIFGTALASAVEQRQLRGDGWQAVLVGNFADRDCGEAGARDVHHAAERIAQAEGRFGGVVWDQTAGAAFAVTDALGWYLLYWAGSPEAFVFSSHLGLLLRLLEPRPPIDNVGAAQLLMFSDHHGRRTCFEGVSPSLPGQMLALHRGAVETTDFDLPFSTDGFGATPRYLQDRFREALLDSVRRRIEGHSRVVLPLSSGFDSRLIGACLRDLGANVACVTHDWRGQADVRGR